MAVNEKQWQNSMSGQHKKTATLAVPAERDGETPLNAKIADESSPIREELHGKSSSSNNTFQIMKF